MSIRLKNIIYTLLLLGIMAAVYFYRNHGKEPLITFSGKTMGPIIYHIQYFDADKRNFQPQIDSILDRFNSSLNTYRPESEVSRFNRDSIFQFSLPYFYPVLATSKMIYELSSGAYDPSIMPLANAWGFGPQESLRPDSATIDSLRKIVGFNRVHFDRSAVWKEDRRIQLDFSASAKGYGVDVVIHYLLSEGVENAFVEIGGEVRTAGLNVNKDTAWTVGILDPASTEVNPYYLAQTTLSNRALATSGNYFNYRIIDGIRYSHTLNPATGYPIVHPLLSASVYADNCMEADALATAFMVMGHEKAIELLKQHPEYDAFLVFDAGRDQISTYATSGVRDKIKIIEN